jgi:O-antigen/teichoic acid export membrane protein
VPLTARLRLGWLAVSDLVGQGVTAVALLTLVLMRAPLLPFFAVTSVVGVAGVILTVALVHDQLTLRPAFQLARWRALMSASFVYAAATALGVIYFRIVVIAVNLLTNAKETGYFGLGFRILDLINAVPWLLVTAAFPILARAARDDGRRLRYALQRLFEGGLILGGWIAIGLVVGAPFVVSVIGGRSYSGSVVVLRMLGVGVPFTFLVATWAFALLSLKLHRQLIVVNAFVVVLAIVLSVALIPAGGATGAAIVTVTLEIVLSGGYAVALFTSRRDLRPSLGQVPRIALALTVAFAVAVVSPVHPVGAVLAGSVVFVAGLRLLGALPDELVQAVAERLRCSRALDNPARRNQAPRLPRPGPGRRNRAPASASWPRARCRLWRGGCGRAASRGRSNLDKRH